MKDRFGREISYLRLSVTELCDLRCRYCMGEEGVCKKAHADMLTEEEMIQAVEAAASLGIRKVRITGGEPLVKPNILSICRRTAAVKGVEEVCLTTNGVRLSALVVPLWEAGVQRVNISLDTLQAEKFAYMARRDLHAQAMEGLRAALAAGFERVKVNAVLIGGFNDDEIPALGDLTKRYPLDVRFIELMPMTAGFSPEAFLPADTVLKRLPDLRPEGEEGVARTYRLPGGLGTVGLISPLSRKFCAQCDRIRLTADGKLKPCLHHGIEYPIKGLGPEKMREQFRRAIWEKPACHGELSAESPSLAGRAMNEIGG